MSAQFVLKQLINTAGITLVNSTELYPALHQPGDVGLPMLVIENSLGRAVMALQGAHLMAFQPSGQQEMFWISPKAILEAGKPIRGGIPLCLPWFGLGLDGKSMHGFARTMEWTLIAAEITEEDTTRLSLELKGDKSTCNLWPHDFDFHLEVEVGNALRLELTVKNTGREPAPLAFVFHTYFAVPHVAEARVSGLEGTTYIDKMDDLTRKVQTGDVAIESVTDRVYLNVPPQQTITTSNGNILIDSATQCAVVWNAWSNDRNVPDLGEGNHVGYLCVERGEVAERTITLMPGTAYRAGLTLSY